jgi:phosphate transport system substrate-binding protein
MEVYMKKISGILLLLALPALGISARGRSEDSAAAFDTQRSINVVSREDGSGTRGAFIELFGIEVRGADGTRRDTTTREAVIANQTEVMMLNIAGDTYGIGYISLGSLNDTVAALSIEGVAATTANVKNGTYPISRPFNIAVRANVSPLARDFIAFILAAEGQAIAAQSYIPVNASAPAFSGTRPAGRIVVAGSSSVTPLMEKLTEAYALVNPAAVIEIQMSDSSAGISAAINGVCDIGMASRELRESELRDLSSIQIAIDGLAVIVNKRNPLGNLSRAQVKSVFTGETTLWSALVP